MIFWILFFLTFIGMEFAAWALHKYVMHGFLWCWHQDHHVVTGKTFQKNDRFALFFAIPSFLLILIGHIQNVMWLYGVGFGIMAYGIAYFMVHEVIIHRRLTFLRGRGFYFLALIRAHLDHHKVQTKEGCFNFGMLIVPWRYFVWAFKRRFL
ncbi:MAG: hypothetical protein RMK80_05705 [Pseudobdellovibrionaceae bacterium]|nr:hypothetical protein [Pseudobdellovibrionaceae bacterium]